jgi:polyhydroxyalkanoate synthesis regulator phasin
MRQDAWRAYLEMLVGMTETSRQRAVTVAKALVEKGGMTAEQLQALADELVRASTANREALTKVVRSELDRALAVVGLVTADEVAALKARVRELETRVAGNAASDETAPAVPASTTSESTTATAVKPTVAKKAVAKKTVAKKSTAKATASAALTKRSDAQAGSGNGGAPAKSSPPRSGGGGS